MTKGTSIAVTGMAWSTALGDDLDAVFQRLLKGETGLVALPPMDRVKNTLAALVPSPSAPPLDEPAADRMLAIGLPALRRAIAAAGIDPADPETVFVFGTSLGAFLEGEPQSAPLHAWSDALGQAVGAASPPVAVSTACSSGSDAILLGAELLRAGLYKRAVCGGVDVLTTSKRLAHSILGTMSPTMLRTFDKRHDGTLLGEGAGFVVLETSPKNEPIAHLRGAGASNDAAGMTMPDATGAGARLAIERSLDDAGLDAASVGVINAHGSGTQLNDATEALAFRGLFGALDPKPIVFGTKGNFGHSLGATGAVEAIAVILALKNGKVPPVVGLEDRDPEMGMRVPAGAPLDTSARVGLSVTLGFGGFDTSLVFSIEGGAAS